MFSFIKNILIPAVKDDIKKNGIETIERTLYNESKDGCDQTIYDFLMMKGD